MSVEAPLNDKIDAFYSLEENDIYEDFDIFVTRFDSITYRELERYKESINKNSYSIYGCSKIMSTTKNVNRRLLWVLEMNNTLNEIVGIGFIKNNVSTTKYCAYSNEKYNKVYYASPFHINLKDGSCTLTTAESNFIHYEFEHGVFRGKSHLKRGQGITKYPDAKIKKKHLMFLLKLYCKHNPSNVFERVIQKYVKV